MVLASHYFKQCISLYLVDLLLSDHDRQQKLLGKGKTKINIWICIAPCPEHTSLAPRCGTQVFSSLAASLSIVTVLNK